MHAISIIKYTYKKGNYVCIHLVDKTTRLPGCRWYFRGWLDQMEDCFKRYTKMYYDYAICMHGKSERCIWYHIRVHKHMM